MMARLNARLAERAALRAALERLADPELRARLERGAERRRAELTWGRAVASVDALLS